MAPTPRANRRCRSWRAAGCRAPARSRPAFASRRDGRRYPCSRSPLQRCRSPRRGRKRWPSPCRAPRDSVDPELGLRSSFSSSAKRGSRALRLLEARTRRLHCEHESSWSARCRVASGFVACGTESAFAAAPSSARCCCSPPGLFAPSSTSLANSAPTVRPTSCCAPATPTAPAAATSSSIPASPSSTAAPRQPAATAPWTTG